MFKAPGNSLRKIAGAVCTLQIRSFLYHSQLTWGAKSLALALLDTPVGSCPSNALLARKLKSTPSQISVWRGELERFGFKIRLNPREFHLSLTPASLTPVSA